jgi:uncharacterized membrane protein
MYGVSRGDVDHLGLSLQNLNNMPPPPRTAPASEGSSRGNGYAASHQARFALRVLLSDERWQSLTFTSADNLEAAAASFLRQEQLKAAFLSGLVERMRGMIASGQAQASIDIVDLV